MLTSLLFTILLAAPGVSAVEMPIGRTEDALLAALKAANVPFQRSAAAGAPVRITWKRGDDAVLAELSPWPSDTAAPASAYAPGARAAGPLKVTHVRIDGKNSPAKRVWVRTLERDGRIWALVPGGARTASDRNYGMVAFLQWWGDGPASSAGRPRVPVTTFLFEAQRPAGSPPGVEPTAIEAFLENPWHPRRF